MRLFSRNRPHHQSERRCDLIVAAVVVVTVVVGLVIAGTVYIAPPGQKVYSAQLVNTGRFNRTNFDLATKSLLPWLA